MAADDNNSKRNNTKPSASERVANPSRRNLLKSAGLVGAAAVSGGAANSIIAADSSNSTNAGNSIPGREALEVLTAEEAEILEAVCDCLIPADDNGPGAREARAVHYIDRSLASHNLSDRETYMIGLNALNDFARKTRRKPFAALIRDQQNSILSALQENRIPDFAIDGSSFFNMLRSHTIDGTFCDPYYGGNRNFVGWDLLRYPGVRLGASEADVAKGASLAPNHQSAYDHLTYTKTAGYMGGDDHA